MHAYLSWVFIFISSMWTASDKLEEGRDEDAEGHNYGHLCQLHHHNAA